MARTYEEALKEAKNQCIQCGGNALIKEDAKGYFRADNGERLTPDQARDLTEVDDWYVKSMM